MEFGLTPGASNWHLHLPQGQASAYKVSSIDHGLGADAIEASAVLQEDSRPQAILKLWPPNSLDYSTRYGCQQNIKGIILESKPLFPSSRLSIRSFVVSHFSVISR